MGKVSNRKEYIQRGNFRDSCILKEILHFFCLFESSCILAWIRDGGKLQLETEALEACADHRYKLKEVRNPVKIIGASKEAGEGPT